MRRRADGRRGGQGVCGEGFGGDGGGGWWVLSRMGGGTMTRAWKGTGTGTGTEEGRGGENSGKGEGRRKWRG